MESSVNTNGQVLDCGYHRTEPCWACVACAKAAAKFPPSRAPQVALNPGVLDCGYNRREPCGECVACTAPRGLECLEGPDGCHGEVAYRWPGYGDRDWPRCERHGELRVQREEAAMARYPDLGPPADWDPMDAGERWDDD